MFRKQSSLPISLIIVLSAVICVGQNPANYQNGIPANATQVPVPLGFISPLSGNLHLEIPIASFPQRNGDTIVAKFIYSTTLYFNTGYGYLPGNYGYSHLVYGMSKSGVVNYDTVQQQCTDPGYNNGTTSQYANFRFVEMDGTYHAFNGYTFYKDCYSSSGFREPDQGSPSSLDVYDLDGSGYHLTVSNWTQAIVRDVHGVTESSWPEDTNGNVGDTMGRTPVTTSATNGYWCQSVGPGYVYTKASDGSQQTFTMDCEQYSLKQDGYTSGNVVLLKSLTLPSGAMYSFTYDTGTTGNHYGALTSVTLPEGGQETFGYTSPGGLGLITSATFGGGTWNLSYNIVVNGQNSQTTTTMTGPSRYDASSQSYVNDKTVFQTITGFVPYLGTAQFFSGSSTLLKTISVTYRSGTQYTLLLPDTITTTLNDTGQSSKTKYVSYSNNTRSLPTNIQEYDYGASTPYRTTKISYGVFNKPVSVGIYAGSGSGSALSSTTYTYDEYGASFCTVAGLTNVTGAKGHDDAGYGIGNWSRGNWTTQSRLISGTTWATSHRCYDTLGNVTQEVDPSGHATSYDYSENWNDAACIPSGTLTRAFPTTVTDALGYQSRNAYYTCTGLAASRTDQNSQTTSFAYDWRARPLSISYPDGGQTTYTYNDTASPASIQRSQSITASQTKVDTTTVDGLGRVVKTQLNSDPEGPDYTDTAYDALGRKLSVNNPYRTGDSTYGLTTFYYDALGRPTRVVPPDGTVSANRVSYSYSGNSTTITDEAGKTRKTQTDALGRLTYVCEDPSGLNLETDYQYDYLGNLTNVTQKGGTTDTTKWRNRAFSYDSLSRLFTASNPESGTVTYRYDSDSQCGGTYTEDLASKTDARGIRTCYQYDGLHRQTFRSYSNGDASVRYCYDNNQAACGASAVTNGIGRRTGMSDGSGKTAWSYDQMGRATWTSQTVGSVAASISYAYNLDGSVSWVLYPDGYFASYSYNAAGRAVSAAWVSILEGGYNYMNNASHTAWGALSGYQNDSGATVSNSYNNRLQPFTMSASAAHGAMFGLTYDFHLGTGDNGNVYGIANNLTSDRSQIFTYDSLNRLNTAGTVNHTCSKCWGNSYSIDAWGNLYQKTPTYGTAENLTFTVANNNQLQSYLYDAAGNLTNAGVPYVTYDAENRWTYESYSGASYLSDGDGKRVKQWGGPSGTTLFWYDTSGNVLLETDQNGTIQKEYCYLGNTRMAYVGGPSYNISYYYNDHLGTPRIITDSSANVCYDADYFPWGGEVQPVQPNSCSQNYKFTGKPRDPDTGSDYFGARWFRYTMARFYSPDWSATPTGVPYSHLKDPQTLNLYSYVRNNPLSKSDPDGHYDVSVSNCNGNDKCQKKYDKKINQFEEARQKDLNSKDPNVRAAAANYGERGEHNGVHVGVQVLNDGTKGHVDASGSGFGKTDIQVVINSDISGKSLQETVAHEGAHVGDDQRYLNSFDSETFQYNETLNPTHGQTEFNAFRAGAGVDREHGFGPNDTQKILDFLHNNPTYGPIFDFPVFQPED